MFDIKKLEKLGYGDCISLKCHIVRPQLRYIQDKIYSSLDDMAINDRFISYFFIDIYASDLEENKDTKIGFIKGCYILPEEYMENCDFFDVCDAENQELMLMAESLIDKNFDFKEGIADITDCICYVSNFYIYKKFRNLGIGSHLINELDDILYYYSRDIITKIVLLPQPRVINNQRHLQNISEKNKDREILKNKLRKFYLDNGFIQIDNSEYMIKNVL